MSQPLVCVSNRGAATLHLGTDVGSFCPIFYPARGILGKDRRVNDLSYCHVMSLSEPLIPFHGVAGCCCWSQSQPCLRARAGYSLDKSPAHHRALTDEQRGVLYLAQGHFDMQLSTTRSWDLNQITSRPALPAELQPPDSHIVGVKCCLVILDYDDHGLCVVFFPCVFLPLCG